MSQLIVTWHGGLFVCRLDANGWRCGKCLRGLLLTRVGDACRVCRAKVVGMRGTVTLLDDT